MTHMLMTHMTEAESADGFKAFFAAASAFATSKMVPNCTTAAHRNPFLVNGAPLEQGAAVGSKLVSCDGVTPCRAGATVVIRENDMLTLSDPPIAVLRVQLRFLEADAESGWLADGFSWRCWWIFMETLMFCRCALCFICDVIGSSCISVADSKGEDMWCQCRHVAMLSRIVIQDSYPLISMIVLVLSC